MRFFWTQSSQVIVKTESHQVIRTPVLDSIRAATSESLEMPDATIHTVGEVLEIMSPVLYRVSLPNGKIILGHLNKELREAGVTYVVADRLLLEMTPFDFDGARILGMAQQESN